METYVHGICPVGGDGIIDYAECCGVVRLNGGGGLQVTHFGECVLGGDRRAAVDVEGANFGFGGGGHDGLNYLRDGQDTAIIRQIGGVI